MVSGNPVLSIHRYCLPETINDFHIDIHFDKLHQ